MSLSRRPQSLVSARETKKDSLASRLLDVQGTNKKLSEHKFVLLVLAAKVEKIRASSYNRYLKESKLEPSARKYKFYRSCEALYRALRENRERYLVAQPNLAAHIGAESGSSELVEHALTMALIVSKNVIIMQRKAAAFRSSNTFTSRPLFRTRSSSSTICDGARLHLPLRHVVDGRSRRNARNARRRHSTLRSKRRSTARAMVKYARRASNTPQHAARLARSADARRLDTPARSVNTRHRVVHRGTSDWHAGANVHVVAHRQHRRRLKQDSLILTSTARHGRAESPTSRERRARSSPPSSPPTRTVRR